MRIFLNADHIPPLLLYIIINSNLFFNASHGIRLKTHYCGPNFIHSLNPPRLKLGRQTSLNDANETSSMTMGNEIRAETPPRLQIAPMLDVTYLQFRYLCFNAQAIYAAADQEGAALDRDVYGLLSSSRGEGRRCVVAKYAAVYTFQNSARTNTLSWSSWVGFLKFRRKLHRHAHSRRADGQELRLRRDKPERRVPESQGCFGAYLMREKELVRDIVRSLMRELDVKVTVKTRLGVDECDSYEFVRDFVATVAQSGCDHFIIHARKAWLKGINPRQNRNIPPLQYERVYRLQQDFPDLKFSINGGFKTMEAIMGALNAENRDANGTQHRLTGVMVGRLAYENPCLLADVDRAIYGVDNPATCATRRILLENYANYIDETAEDTAPMNTALIVKPILGVFHGEHGSKIYRQALSNFFDHGDFSYRTGKTKHSMFIHQAIDLMERVNPEGLDRPLY